MEAEDSRSDREGLAVLRRAEAKDFPVDRRRHRPIFRFSYGAEADCPAALVVAP